MNLKKLSNKQLNQIYDDLNHWKWNEYAGKEPEGWVNKTYGEKYRIVKPILSSIEKEQLNRKIKRDDKFINFALVISIVSFILIIISLI